MWLNALNHLKDIVLLRSRMRYLGMTLGLLLFVATYLLSDPDAGIITQLSFGTAILSVLIPLTKITLYGLALHMLRKSLLDYMDLEEVFHRARTSSTGSGMIAIAVGLIMIAIAIIISAAVAN